MTLHDPLVTIVWALWVTYNAAGIERSGWGWAGDATLSGLGEKLTAGDVAAVVSALNGQLKSLDVPTVDVIFTAYFVISTVTTLLLGLAAKGKEALVDTTQDVRAYATAAAAIQVWVRAPWVKEYSNTLAAVSLLRLLDLLALPGMSHVSAAVRAFVFAVQGVAAPLLAVNFASALALVKLIPKTVPTFGAAMRTLFFTGTLLQDLAGVGAKYAELSYPAAAVLAAYSLTSLGLLYVFATTFADTYWFHLPEGDHLGGDATPARRVSKEHNGDPREHLRAAAD